MIAVLALFVALGGSAVAAGIVLPAQHAYTANSATVAGNARHLGGKTAAQIAATQADLPSSGTTGDAYLVVGDLYVWTGSAWTNAGPVQGPPGTAAVSVHTQSYTLPPDGEESITGTCGAGQQAVNGGFDSSGNSVFNLDTRPTAGDDGWQMLLVNADTANAASGTFYAICLG
jgi:hypothetical protein